MKYLAAELFAHPVEWIYMLLDRRAQAWNFTLLDSCICQSSLISGLMNYVCIYHATLKRETCQPVRWMRPIIPGLVWQVSVEKDGTTYKSVLEIKDVTVEDAGKYKVTARNELGESNATISLNFDSGFCPFLSSSARHWERDVPVRWGDIGVLPCAVPIVCQILCGII